MGGKIGKKDLKRTISTLIVASSLAVNLPLNTLSVEAASNLLQTTSNTSSNEGVSVSSIKVNATSKKVTTSAIETITKVSKGTVVFGKKTFKYDNSLNGFFSNSNALKSAKIQFAYDGNKVIKQLMYLEISTAGKASKSSDKTYKNNSVLDGKGIVINGKIKVNADYITLKNITATKDLELTSKVKHVFYTSKVTVKGKTYVSSTTVAKTASTNSTDNGKKSMGQAFYKSLSYLVPTSFIPNATTTNQTTSVKLVLVFEGSKISKIEIKSDDTTIQTIGNSTITDLSLGGNSTVQNGKGSTISNVNLQNGADEVSLNGNIGTVNINNSSSVQVNGNGTISTLRITANGSSVEININGVIHTINADALGGDISVGDDTSVDKVIVTKEFEITSLDEIGQIIVNGDVPNLTINAPVHYLQVNGSSDVTIDGTSTIGELNLNSSGSVQVNVPKVESLTASDSNKGKVVLGANTKIDDAETKDLFQNQNQLNQVGLIGGQPVGGASVPTGGGRLPTGPVIVANPERYVQKQDFGYWEDAGEGRPAYNVGFKLDLTKLSYNVIKEIKITLLDANGNEVATRTASANQIQKLKEDDGVYGGLDGQLSAAFSQRDESATNDWWTSTSYDFTSPAKAVIQITDNFNNIYKVENSNPTNIPAGPVMVQNAENYIQKQDFGYWEDAGEGRPAYNVGFKIDLEKLPYNLMKEIKVTLLDTKGNVVATRTAKGDQIKTLQSDDATYGELDGQLSAAFLQRDNEATNNWWTSSAYDFSTPTIAVIQITDKDNKVYKVENNTPTGIPVTPEVANPESYVQTQDFGYWEDAGAGRPAYNVGFKLDLEKLPYNMIKEIKISLVDGSGNPVATRTATGTQIQQLKADDLNYGGEDGQLSAAFIQRDSGATNEWWTSTAYDFTAPSKAIIEITNKDNKVYKVENGNPTGIPVGPVANSDNFVQPQDFGFWNNYDGEGNLAYNVGFKLDLTKLPYNMVREIKIMLVDENGQTVATRTATGSQIQQLKTDDKAYGEEEGQLSAAFTQRDVAGINNWWTSTSYDFSTPAKAVIQITDKDQKVYLVENDNPTGIPNSIMLTNANSTSYYTNLDSAVNAAQDGDIVYVPKGTYELNSQIRIENSITLIGAGASTIITKGSTPWTNDTGSKGYASLITINSGDKAVRLQNITVTGATDINMTGSGSGTDFGSGINVVSSSNVILNNVTSTNNSAAGLIVNSSNVTANNLNTSGNRWYGVNVDKRDGGNASFTLTGSGVLGEGFQILSESPSFVTVNAIGYTSIPFIGGMEIWQKIV